MRRFLLQGSSPRPPPHGLTGAEVSKVTPRSEDFFSELLVSQSFLAASWEKTGEFQIPSPRSRFTPPIPTSLLLTPNQHLNARTSVRTSPSDVYDLIILRDSGVRTEVSPARPGSGKRSPPWALPPGAVPEPQRETRSRGPRRRRRHSDAPSGPLPHRDLSSAPSAEIILHTD